MKTSHFATAAAIVSVPIIAVQFAQNSKLKTEVEELNTVLVEYQQGGGGAGGLSGMPAGKSGDNKSKDTTKPDPAGSQAEALATSSSLSEILAHRDPMLRMAALLEYVGKLSDKEIPEALAKLRQSTPDWDPDARVAAQLMLTRWGKADPEGALAHIGKLDMKSAGGDAAIILSALAATDPLRAVEWLENPDNKLANSRWIGQILAGSITKEWVRQDPDAALAWAQTVPENQRSGAYTGVLGSLAATDPERASKLAMQLPDDDARREILGQIARSWSEISPAEAVEWASTLDGRGRSRAMGEALGEWAQKSPPEAAAFVDSLPEAGEGQYLQRVASSWAEHAPADAAQWLESHQESEGKADAMGWVMWHWTNSDPQAASTWLIDQPAGGSRDRAIGSLAKATFESDPGAAVTWAATITDERQRAGTLERGVREWLEREPVKAREWISTTDQISQEEAQRFLTPRGERDK